MLACFCCQMPGADENASQTAHPVIAKVELAYQKIDASLEPWSAVAKLQAQPFKKEPPLAAGKTIRGTLNLQGDIDDPMPFLWQREAGILYIDVARGQDFTADSVGHYSTQKPNLFCQFFTNVYLHFRTPLGDCPMLVDIKLWDYGTQLFSSFTAHFQWQGKLSLDGQDWQVGIVPDFYRGFSFKTGRLCLRPWEKKDQPIMGAEEMLNAFPFPTNLFLNGRAFQLSWLQESAHGELKPTLQFVEQSLPLGEVEIIGKYIDRLVLRSSNYLAVFEPPAEVIKLPAGIYAPPSFLLAQKEGPKIYYANTNGTGRSFSVDDKTRTILAIGGPLTNCVNVSRYKQELCLNYLLIGSGGITYPPQSLKRSKLPKFTIYKAGKPIASGRFEYG